MQKCREGACRNAGHEWYHGVVQGKEEEAALASLTSTPPDAGTPPPPPPPSPVKENDTPREPELAEARRPEGDGLLPIVHRPILDAIASPAVDLPEVTWLVQRGVLDAYARDLVAKHGALVLAAWIRQAERRGKADGPEFVLWGLKTNQPTPPPPRPKTGDPKPLRMAPYRPPGARAEPPACSPEAEAARAEAEALYQATLEQGRKERAGSPAPQPSRAPRYTPEERALIEADVKRDMARRERERRCRR
jgi:hypothetical protein